MPSRDRQSRPGAPRRPATVDSTPEQRTRIRALLASNEGHPAVESIRARLNRNKEAGTLTFQVANAAINELATLTPVRHRYFGKSWEQVMEENEFFDGEPEITEAAHAEWERVNRTLGSL